MGQQVVVTRVELTRDSCFIVATAIAIAETGPLIAGSPLLTATLIGGASGEIKAKLNEVGNVLAGVKRTPQEISWAILKATVIGAASAALTRFIFANFGGLIGKALGAASTDISVRIISGFITQQAMKLLGITVEEGVEALAKVAIGGGPATAALVWKKVLAQNPDIVVKAFKQAAKRAKGSETAKQFAEMIADDIMTDKNRQLFLTELIKARKRAILKEMMVFGR